MVSKVTDQYCSLDYEGINDSDDSMMQIIITIIDIKNSLGKVVGLTMDDTTMNVYVHEDNACNLVLARTFTTQFNLCSKHYATNTFWFCEEIVKREIKLLKIDTVEQLGDLFTNFLPITKFEYLSNKIRGW